MRRCSVLALTMLVVCLGAQVAYSDVVSFTFNFDENGHATYQLWEPTLNGGSGGYGPVVNDPGYPQGGYLTFTLPIEVGEGECHD